MATRKTVEHAARSAYRPPTCATSSRTSPFNPPRSLAMRLALSVFLPALLSAGVLGLWSQSALAADMHLRSAISLKGFNPRVPANCEQTSVLQPEEGGLCLLFSAYPGVSGDFYVRPVKEKGTGEPESGILVSGNLVLSLPPGAYEIFKSTGIDAQSPAKVAVRAGRVTTVKTMTLYFGWQRGWPFSRGWPAQTYKIQRFQALPGTNNGGCTAEFIKSGFHAFLPGNYVVNLPGFREQESSTCEIGGTTFNAVSGQGYTVRKQGIGEQILSKAETYVHRNGVSALSAISPAMHGIQRLGWLGQWRLHRGIPSPDQQAHSALAFYGPGNYTYLVPFRFRYNGKVCGVSLAQGGLSESDLLTHCTFQGNRLTGFKVNKGNYFTYHNLYGMPGISANAIVSSFEVENVNFKIPRGY
ncbi:MAG: hypothetical protein EOM24_06775 [Chloroflexia bacterium]|nr:hypothetical protein [Chloroflexia bacterium]